MKTKLHFLDNDGELTTWWLKFTAPLRDKLIDYEEYVCLRDEQLNLYHAKLSNQTVVFASDEYATLFLLKFS
jgi:hypothetical protein